LFGTVQLSGETSLQYSNQVVGNKKVSGSFRRFSCHSPKTKIGQQHRIALSCKFQNVPTLAALQRLLETGMVQSLLPFQAPPHSFISFATPHSLYGSMACSCLHRCC
jgi:hypothetical protein